MGKPKRVDLGGIDQDRKNKIIYSQPRLNQAQGFLSKPARPSSTLQMALGKLRGVNIVDPATNDVLTFDGSFWIATTSTATGSSSGISLPVTMPVHDFGTVTTSTISHSFSETSAHVLKMILATDTTLTFTSIPSQHIEFELDVTQDSTGGYDLNYNSASITLSSTPEVQTGASRQTIMIGQTHGLTTTTTVFHIFDTAFQSAGAGDNLGNHIMTQDLDAASFDISSVVDIDFKAGGNADAYIHSSGAGLQIKCATGDAITFIEGTTLMGKWDSGDLYMATNDIRSIQALYFELTTSSIAGISGALQTNVPSLSAHQFQIASNKRFEIIGATVSVTDAVLDMNSNSIRDITVLYGAGVNSANEYIQYNTSSIVFQYPNPGQLYIRGGATLICQFENDDLYMASHDITACQILSFNQGGQLAGISSDMTYNVGSGFQHIIQHAGNDQVYVGDHDVTIIATDTAFSILSIYRATTPAAAVGEIDFAGLDASSNVTLYSYIQGLSIDNTNGSENGKIDFYVNAGGSATLAMSVDSSGASPRFSVFGLTPQAQINISGSSVTNALSDLLTVLALYGFITDSTTF